MIEQDIKTAIQNKVNAAGLRSNVFVYVTGEIADNPRDENRISIRITNWIPAVIYGERRYAVDIEVTVLSKSYDDRVQLANLIDQLHGDTTISDDINTIRIQANSPLTLSEETAGFIQQNLTIFSVEANKNPFT